MVPWLEWAIQELRNNVEEIPGDKHNLRILEYHLETSLKATTDEIPWCSSFLCSAFEETGIPSTRSAKARSWLKWGIGLDRPKEGSVTVLWRGTHDDGSRGHVGLYVGEEKNYIKLLGGNQSNKVCVKRYPKFQVLGYRWPSLEHWSDVSGRDDDDICNN